LLQGSSSTGRALLNCSAIIAYAHEEKKYGVSSDKNASSAKNSENAERKKVRSGNAGVCRGGREGGIKGAD
jgi:hypothetical protein